METARESASRPQFKDVQEIEWDKDLKVVVTALKQKWLLSDVEKVENIFLI